MAWQIFNLNLSENNKLFKVYFSINLFDIKKLINIKSFK